MSDMLEIKADLSALPKHGKVIVGFSGGADSMALVHFLANKIDSERILCVHLNHMLRAEEADRDEAATQSFCKANGLRFVLKRIDIKRLAQKRKIGLEECGREERYALFESLVESGDDRILTAHNANDNAETVVMNLAKGTGIDGLCGIPYKRGNILRPLINVSRSEIEDYCTMHDLKYVTDSSNLTDEYTRNRVRSHIVPELERINPRAVEAISQMSESLLADKIYLDNQAKNLLEEAGVEHGLNIAVLKTADSSVLARALKLHLQSEGCGRVERKHIESVACSLENGQRISLPNDVTANISGDFLSLDSKKEQKRDWQIEVSDESTRLPSGKTLKFTLKKLEKNENKQNVHRKLFNYAIDYDTITGVLVARNRREGDKITLAGRNVSKSLKKLFVEMKIPAQYRDDVTVLEADGEIVFVEGVGAAEKFKLTENTETAAIIELEGAKG